MLCLLLIAIAAPVIAPYDPTHAAMKDAFLEPGAQHLFGTDKLGRDCFSRVLYGARASLTGVLVLVASVFVVGTTMGVVSGYFGGKVDMVIMRISDMMISFPGMILQLQSPVLWAAAWLMQCLRDDCQLDQIRAFIPQYGFKGKTS